MPLKLLHRYVLLELLRVFVLSQIAVTGIVVTAFIVNKAWELGAGPIQILRLIPMSVLVTLPVTIPTTTLFAVAVVYGRLSRDNEINAIKSAGVPVTTVVWPAWIIGAALGGFVLLLSGWLIPHIHQRVHLVLRENLEDMIYATLRKNLCFNQPGIDYAIWVKEVQGRRLIRPTFKKRDALGRDEIVAQAREAEIRVDLAEGLVNIHMLHANISREGRGFGYLNEEVIQVPLPPLDRRSKKSRPRELYSGQILEERQQYLKQRAEKVAYIEQFIARDQSPGKEHSAKEVVHLKNELNLIDREIWSLETEYAMRPAMALGSLFFVLIGCPVGIWFHKGDYLSAFVTCFLPIVFCYYPLLMFGFNLGKEGRMDPTYSMWVANVALGLAGLVLMWRLTRR